jgi:copper chaperone CopZ
MVDMQRAALGSVLASFMLVSGLALTLGACGGGADEASFPVERSRCTVEVAVPNMACETACPIKVRALLSDVEGVERVEVDFEQRRATVEGVWPACGHKGMRKMLANLKTRGYEGQIVSSQ